MTNARRMLAGGGLTLGDLTALVRLRPDPGALAGDIAAPHAWVAAVGPDGAAITLAGAALWCVALWLGVGLLAALATQLPGSLGRIAGFVSRVLLPAAVCRAVAGAAGLGVLLAPVAASAVGGVATSSPQPSGGTQAVTSLTAPSIPAPTWPVRASRPAPTPPAPVWPGSPAPRPPAPAGPTTAAVPAAPNPTRASRPARRAQPAPPAHGSGQGGGVVVRPGDSLWELASARLGGRPAPGQVATAWPRWYAANRSVIGADPGLIRPGQLLQPPASTRGSQ